jgi:hypothetical protein
MKPYSWLMARYMEFLQVLIDIGLGIYPVLVRIRLFSHIKIIFSCQKHLYEMY